MHACTYQHTHARMHARTHARTHTHTYTHTHTHTHTQAVHLHFLGTSCTWSWVNSATNTCIWWRRVSGGPCCCRDSFAHLCSFQRRDIQSTARWAVTGVQLWMHTHALMHSVSQPNPLLVWWWWHKNEGRKWCWLCHTSSLHTERCGGLLAKR